MVNIHTATTYMSKALVSVSLVVGLGISAQAQSASEAEVQYSSILQQISNVELNIAHKEAYIASQKAEIESLKAQLAGVDKLTASVNPMISKMAAAISNEIEKDVPFNAEERFNRLGDFQDVVNDKEALPLEKMRKALNIYQAEVDYGQTFASYAGNHPVADRQGTRLAACLEDSASGACALTRDQQKLIAAGVTVNEFAGDLEDGNYLRFGRLALIYAQADGSDVYQYDPTSKAWAEVKGGRALDLVQYVKMARGEAAVNVVTAPVYMAE